MAPLNAVIADYITNGGLDNTRVRIELKKLKRITLPP